MSLLFENVYEAPSAPIASTSKAAHVAPRVSPKQRSCDSCRIRKIACSFRTERPSYAAASSPSPPGSLANVSTPPIPCRGCEAKGLPCKVTKPREPIKRNRVGTRLHAILQSHTASPSASNPAEERLSLRAFSGRLGHILIGSCTGQAGVDAVEDRPPFCAPIVDKWSVHNRYEAAGTLIDHLSPQDQILVSVLLALGAQKLPEGAFSSFSRSAAFQILSERAEDLADQASLWRKTDPGSINIMIMMWQVVSNGRIVSPRARRYLRVALAALEELGPEASPLVDRASCGYDCYLALLLIDSACALEEGEPPAMRQSTVNSYTRTAGLPSVDRLWQLAQLPGAACLVTINGDALEFAGLLLRTTAAYVAELFGGRMEGSVRQIQLVQQQLDGLSTWLIDALALHGVESYIALYLDIIACAAIAAEAGIVKALQQIASSKILEERQLAQVLRALGISKDRLSRAVDQFVNATANNGHSRNSLALMSGVLWSSHRLADILSSVDPQSEPQLGWLSRALCNVSDVYSLGQPLGSLGEPGAASMGDANHAHMLAPALQQSFDPMAADSLIAWLNQME